MVNSPILSVSSYWVRKREEGIDRLEIDRKEIWVVLEGFEEERGWAKVV